LNYNQTVSFRESAPDNYYRDILHAAVTDDADTRDADHAPDTPDDDQIHD
jgi:hypothetical protein